MFEIEQGDKKNRTGVRRKVRRKHEHSPTIPLPTRRAPCCRGVLFDLQLPRPLPGLPPGSCLPVARTGAAVKAHPDVVGPAHAHARLGHALEAATPARLGVGGPRLLQRQLAQREHAAQRGHLVRVPYGVRLRCAGLRPPMQPVAASGTPRLQCWAAVLGCSAGLQRRWAASARRRGRRPLRLTVR